MTFKAFLFLSCHGDASQLSLDKIRATYVKYTSY